MNFEFQNTTINRLQDMASQDKHSILISGCSGCGKTYVAEKYGQMLNVDSVVHVDPSVDQLREAIETSYKVSTSTLIIIENLDLGTKRASYTILKFLEEPVKNMYIIVTCRDTYQIPSTIVSRCIALELGHPTVDDICEYANKQDFRKFDVLKSRSIWKVVKSFSDVDNIYHLSVSQMEYFDNFPELLRCKDSVSNLIWNFSHYKDNSEIDYELMFRYILYISKDPYVRKMCLDCMKDLTYGRVAKFAILSKFVMECKYGGV